MHEITTSCVKMINKKPYTLMLFGYFTMYTLFITQFQIQELRTHKKEVFLREITRDVPRSVAFPGDGMGVSLSCLRGRPVLSEGGTLYVLSRSTPQATCLTGVPTFPFLQA